MIQKKPCYTTDDGKVFASLEEAQRHEIIVLLKVDENLHPMIDEIMANAPKIIDILTTTATSKPKARKVNGGRKPRTPKAVESTAPTQQLGAQ